MLARSAMYLALLSLTSFIMSSSGCGQVEKAGDSSPSNTKAKDKDNVRTETKHTGWWCQEHGIPEHLCSLCNEDVAASCKKAGDWCQLHDRARSQCFKCEPALYQKFAAMYETQFGSKPKPPPKEEFEK